MDKLTLIIPAKNEKESLPSVLEELIPYNLKTIVILEREDIDTINAIQRFDCKILYQEKNINKTISELLNRPIIREN